MTLSVTSSSLYANACRVRVYPLSPRSLLTFTGFTDAFYKELNNKYPEGTETCSQTSLWNVETGGMHLTFVTLVLIAVGYSPSVYFKPSEVWEIRGAEYAECLIHSLDLIFR